MSTHKEFCENCVLKKTRPLGVPSVYVLKEIVFPDRICRAKYHHYLPRKDVALHEVRQYSVIRFSRHIEWLKPAE